MAFELDHVAIPSADIAKSVAFYAERFGAEVLFQDATWAFLRLGQGKLALVTPSRHPPHVAVRVSDEDLTEASAREGIPIDSHRDGTKGIYLPDPDGNQIELICYPSGTTVYDAAKSLRSHTNP